MRMEWLSEIKVLVWDLDGTLYQEVPALTQVIHQAAIKLIRRARDISSQEAESLFWETYRMLGSSTKSLIELGVDQKTALSGEWYASAQYRYLKKDKRLKVIFKKLKNYRHILHTNSTLATANKKIVLLGLKSNLFFKIISCPDVIGKLKPDPASFEAILRHTGLKPKAHLYIGDRVPTDLIPAKKIGMHTCLVWGQSPEADICLPQVYDVGKLFSSAQTN